MQVKDIYESVAGMTGDRALEDIKQFYSALNRSVKQINRIRRKEKQLTIIHNSLTKTSESEDIIVVPATETSESVTIDNAMYINFAYNGKGVANITVGDSTAVVPLSNTNGVYKFQTISLNKSIGIIEPDEVSITFQGVDKLTICHIKAYIGVIGDKPTICDDFITYDVKSVAPDFEGFATMPLTSLHAEEISYRFTDSELLIPIDAPTETIVIYYYAKRTAIEYDDEPGEDTTEIDVRSDLEDLLELLCSYYCHVYDEPDIAQQFLRDYNEQLAMYRMNHEAAREETLVDRTGWLT